MRSFLLLLLVAALFVVFVLDVLTPHGLSDWILYLVPLILSARLPYRYGPAVTGAVVAGLITVGYFVSPDGPLPHWMAIINRVVGISLTGFVAVLLTARKFDEAERERLLEGLRAANADLSALSRLTEDVVGNLDAGELLAVLVGRLREVLGAEAAAVVLREGGEYRVAVSSPDGVSPAVQTAVAGVVAARGPQYIPGPGAAAGLGLPAGVDPPVWMGAPLRGGGDAIGALVLAWSAPRADPGRDLRLLAVAADRCAGALTAARLVADLRASEARHRLLFEASPVPMWVYDTETLRFLAVNGAAEVAYGYTRDEFRAMTLTDLHPPEEAAAVRAQAAAVGPGFQTTGPWRHQTRGGLEIEADVTTHPITYADRPARLVLARDVTQQNRLARERDAVAHRLELILDRMPLACVTTDREFRVTGWNPAAERVFGFPRGEVLGRTPFETFVPPAARGHVEAVRGRLDAGADFRGESENRTRDGRAIWCEWHDTPLYDGGELVGYLAMAQDVTDRRRAEQALRAMARKVLTAQEQERRAIARELHDEVGQVLTAVGINLQALKRYCPSEAMPTLEDSAAVVAEAIRQVRGLSLDLRPPMLDDFGLAAAVKWYAGQQGRRAGLPVEAEVGAAVPRLPAEVEAGCFRVAQEAVTNALRHARPARIRVALDAAGDELVLRVADDGVGFDPRGNGGFGLTGMRERAELLGGQLAIDSAPGRGTTVALRVPLPG